MRFSLIAVFTWLVLPTFSCAQPGVTANDEVPAFNAPFDYGVNPGYFPPYFEDKQLASLVHGLPDGSQGGYGITSMRPGLFEFFFEENGYEARLPQFKFYDSIGLRNMVAILGFPGERSQENAFHCPGQRSEMFKNLYEPIWDNGENGTAINEKNPYALYVWRAATTYKGLIRIYEVWNEPDYDLSGNAWKSIGMPGNWWENPPEPCDTKLKAPIYFYIRTLRITYEVLKTVDPQAYVAVGGLGWPSYLDAICRYTDNPFDGLVTEKYPLLGGAYFDCMSFHSYPHLDNSLRKWDNANQQFIYFRHSDAAVNGVWRLKNQFDTVLKRHGYNDEKFPEKIWICSEFNLPRKAYKDYIGSEAAQVNFVTKALITAQMNNMKQMHVYSLADAETENGAESEFSFMGMFKNLNGVTPDNVRPNALAFAIKTTQQLLGDATYSPSETARLQLPETVMGAAFKKPSGAFIYALWAITTEDKNENNEIDYTFPTEMGFRYMNQKYWHYSRTGVQNTTLARQIKLGNSPSFFTSTQITNKYSKQPQINPNPTQNGFAVLSFWVFEDSPVTIELFDNTGKLLNTIAQNEALIEGPHARLIDLSRYAKGSYLVRIVTRESNLCVRLIKV
jgi:hypothetical protein